MSIDELPNKSVRYWTNPKARAKDIKRLGQRNEGSLEYVIREVRRLHTDAQGWYYLSSPEKILLEQRWTDTLLSLLSMGNNYVLHSIGYRLREQTPEEDEA
jgi:hypothetical protein